MSGHYFFLSYARADRATEKPNAIEQFYADLTEEIRFQTGEAPETISYGTEAEDEIGFLDTDVIKPGEEWPGAVEDALRSCRAFVPILSPTYITRPRCGKEWSVFRGRLRADGLPGAKLHPLIQPVLLVPPDRIKAQPTLVGQIQRDSPTYPEPYSANGLRNLVKTGDEREYRAFIAAFAKHLIDAVEKYPLAPGERVPPLDEIASVFDEVDPKAEVKGPRCAAFMFVAGRRDELETIRESLQTYGAGGPDWQPYLPDATDVAAQIATEIANKEGFEREFLTADDHAFTRIEQALEDRKVVAVIADTWTLRLKPYQQQMTRLDRTNYVNCVVMVLWNERDDETKQSRAQLESALQAAFPANWTYKHPDRFIEVSSAEDLRKRLTLALTKTRLLMMGDVSDPKEAGGAPMSLPGISGHGGIAA